MRSTVDSSIWVSALLSDRGASAKILAAARAGRFRFVTSAPLLEELGQPLARPGMVERYRLTWRDAEQLLAQLNRLGELVPVTQAAHGCRDPRDDIVIETALQGEADFLISNDKDLYDDARIRELLARSGVRVVTAGQFMAELEKLEKPSGSTALDSLDQTGA